MCCTAPGRGDLAATSALRCSGWAAGAAGALIGCLVWVVEVAFYLFDAGIPAANAQRLQTMVANANRAGFPIRVALVATIVTTLLLPWPGNPYVLALLIGLAGIAFGTFYTPGMTLLTHVAEERGLDYGYAFALVNIAWAPGQAGGAALGGALAFLTSDAVSYLTLAAVCIATLAVIAGYRETTAPVAAER